MQHEARLARNLAALRGFSFFTYPLAVVPLLWFFYRDRGLGLQDYAALISIGYAAMVLFELPTGWLADRIGRKRPMVLGPLLYATGWFLTWAADDFGGYAGGQIVLSLGHALLSGPPTALLYENLAAVEREDQYLREESAQWRRVVLGSALAFLLGGTLGQLFSLDLVVLVTAGLCACAAGFALRIDEAPGPSRGHDSRHGSKRQALPWRILTILRQREVLWVVLIYVLIFVLLRYSFHTWQPWLEAAQHDEPLTLGALYASFSFVSLPFVSLAPRLAKQLGDEVTLLLCCALLGISLIALSYGPSIWLAPFLYVQQIPFALHRPLVHAYANHRIPSTDRALVLSLLSVAGRLGFALTFAFILESDTVIERDYYSVGLVSLILLGALAVLRPR